MGQASVDRNHDLELLVCLLLAFLGHIQSSKPGGGQLTRVDVVAAGLWSALSFQPLSVKPKLEALREALLTACKTHTLAVGERSRSRIKVPDMAIPGDLADFAALNKALKPAADSAIAALRQNAIIYREELDILWWALGDWSEVLNERISAMDPEIAAVVCGIEVGLELRKLPADGHKNIALRHVTSTASVTLLELVKALDDKRGPLIDAIAAGGRLATTPTLFPLLLAIESGKSSSAGSKQKRPLRDWGARALLEVAVLNMALPDSGI